MKHPQFKVDQIWRCRNGEECRIIGVDKRFDGSEHLRPVVRYVMSDGLIRVSCPDSPAEESFPFVPIEYLRYEPDGVLWEETPYEVGTEWRTRGGDKATIDAVVRGRDGKLLGEYPIRAGEHTYSRQGTFSCAIGDHVHDLVEPWSEPRKTPDSSFLCGDEARWDIVINGRAFKLVPVMEAHSHA